MTERAKERAEYKAKKRLPAPEIIKPRPHRDKKKNFIIEERWIPDDKAKQSSWFMRMMGRDRLEWQKYRKYRTGVDAARALANLEGHPRYNWNFGKYEYRLREIK